MRYTIDGIGMDFVIVNGERITVGPPFETIPDKTEYQNWLNKVVADAIETIGSREEVPHLKDHFA